LKFNNSNKYIFTCLKGIGDALILINFLHKKKNVNVTVLLSERLHFLIDYFPSMTNIIMVDNRLCSIYFIKKNFYHLPFFIKLRKLLIDYINLDYKLVLFDDCIKNKFFLYNIEKFVFSGKNIYENYEDFFITNTKFLNINNMSKYFLIFPFGNSMKRSMNITFIDILTNGLTKRKIEYKFLVHNSVKFGNDFNKFKKNTFFFRNFNEIDSLINKSNNIITVDSSSLHYSIMNKLNIYLFTSSWKRYIPKFLFDQNKVFNFNELDNFFAVLSNDYGN